MSRNPMAMSNQDQVGRGLTALAEGLAPFVDARMTGAVADGQDWVAMLAARDQTRYGGDRRYSRSDVRFLLRVVTEEWRAFKDSLSRAEQSFASELRETGNRWAHGEAFSADDTYRALDTMERLLRAIGANEQADHIRQLRTGHEPKPARAAAPAVAAAATPAPRAAASPEATAGQLEASFHRAMVAIYETAKRELGYTATRFLQMISQQGGLATARQLLQDDRPQEGFTTLWMHHRLDLTVEAHVLQPQFSSLFTEAERQEARRRLEQYGWHEQP
jgi:hypothetical protein